MAKRKINRRKTIRKPRVSSSNGPTYDTLMIVTILLLLFVYPIGIVFMWAWMRTWPTWLKIIISAPFIIALFFLILITFLISNVVHKNLNRAVIEEKRIEQMQKQTPITQTSLTPTPQITY